MVIACNFQSSVAALLVALTVLVSPLCGQSQASNVAAGLHGEPIVLEVCSGQQTAPAWHGSIAIDSALKEIFTAENPVQWAPDEKQAPLALVDLSGAQGSKTVSLGTEPTNDVVIAFEREQLWSDQPRKFSVTVRDPARLTPGVYRGKITSRLNSARLAGVEKEYSWEVTLRVCGRRLGRIVFGNAERSDQGYRLPVGKPATVSILLDTVSCSTGEGLLELRLRGQPVARIPLPLDGVADALATLPHLKNRLLAASGQSALWPNAWSEQPLTVQMVPRGESGSLPLQQLEIRVGLPAIYEPGEWSAHLFWERAEETALRDHASTAVSVLASAGILVSHPIAIVGEPLIINVLSPQDLGASIPLVIGSRAKNEVAQLRAERAEIDSQGSKGPYIQYRTEKWNAPSLGEYSVRVESSAAAANKALADIPETPLRVVLDARPHKTGRSVWIERTISIFDGPPPFWWSWQYGPGESNGYECTRANAVAIGANPDQWKKLSARVTAIDRIENGARRLDSCDLWRREPAVSFPSQPDASDGTLTICSNSTTIGQPLRTWTQSDCPNNQLSVHLKVEIPEEPSDDDEKAAKVHGDRGYTMRLLVSGESGGFPTARIIPISYRVEVTTDWAYYWPLITWGGGALAIVLMGSVIGLAVNRQLSPKGATASAPPPVPVSTIDLSPDPLDFKFDDDIAIAPSAASPVVAPHNGNGAGSTHAVAPLAEKSSSSNLLPDDLSS